MPASRLSPRLARCFAAALVVALAASLVTPVVPAVAAQSPALPPAPDQSIASLHRLVAGLSVTPRVLVVGMHPDDADEELITWLSRGRNIETAYLSITRGESGANFLGEETGAALGAIRTQESLAARRIDGAQQFFTRMYDFGAARNADEVFKQWNRDTVVGDMLAVIRAFRPHVIIAILPDSNVDGDGQHQALAPLIEHAFFAASDPNRYLPRVFGAPWPVAKLYRYGAGVHIDAAEIDRLSGRTYVEIAAEARAQNRSQGLAGVNQLGRTTIDLRRVATRDSRPSADRSLFDGIDTSFARLSAEAVPDLAAGVSGIIAYADSARRALDLMNPGAAVPYLAQVARLATSARAGSMWCRHPSATAAPPVESPPGCDPPALDFDAAIDLVRERSTAALLAAAGVSFQATSDRELVASGDTAVVMIAVHNRGALPATLEDLAVWGSGSARLAPVVVRPDSVVHFFRTATNLDDPHPWWIGPREANRFQAVPSSIDGLARGRIVPKPLTTFDVAVPEHLRRASDVTVTVTIAGATVTTSIGPVIYRHADAVVGLQNRPLAGIPAVTIQFPRGLEWIPAGKPVSRTLNVMIKSHSDKQQTFRLGTITPNGLRIDSLPLSLTLEPREQRNLLLSLRGKLGIVDRDPFALLGLPPAGERYQTGLQLIQREYLPPIRLLPSSGMWIQPIDIKVPSNLSVIYVPGVSDDNAAALKQVGVWTSLITTTDQLLSIVDLSKISTIAIGPRALELHPELVSQTSRLLDYVRGGGTLVVLRGDNATISSRLFPFPIAVKRPIAERVTQADAPVTPIDAKARLLNWPNVITDADWAGWGGARAPAVPSVVDPRYGHVIEMHDPDQPENRNGILVARLGKGTIVYTALTIDQQIAAGVPGALRLFVNLLSAGLPRP